MKFLLANFSISNGGDFLIEKRMNDLIKRSWPDARIDFINGTKNFTETIYGNYDAVFGGVDHVLKIVS